MISMHITMHDLTIAAMAITVAMMKAVRNLELVAHMPERTDISFADAGAVMTMTPSHENSRR